MGRCPSCGAWETLVEEAAAGAGGREAIPRGNHADVVELGEIDTSNMVRIQTGIAELDRVLGGGLVPGSVVLLAGEPGIGKSTLAL